MTTKKKATKSSNSKHPHVIIRAYSGVFFGRLVARKGGSAELADARQIWSWNSVGLAQPVNTCGDIALRGVGAGSKVSSPVPRSIVADVKATFFCLPESVAVLDAQKWGTK